MKSIAGYRYQIVLLGEVEKYKPILQDAVNFSHLHEGEKELIAYLDIDEVDYKLPVVGIYLGREGKSHVDAGKVELLQKKGVPILPVYENKECIETSIPKTLLSINAILLTNKKVFYNVIVPALLREFHLTREKKKVFISYCRQDGMSLATLLHDEMVHRGFETFLDSYSIDSGLDFQEELHEFLADSDLAIWLHSPLSESSYWVRDELTAMNRLQIGVVEVLWPDVCPTQNNNKLTYPVRLHEVDMLCPFVRKEICRHIADCAERWRIRSIQSRIATIKEAVLNSLNNKQEEITVGPSSMIVITPHNSNDVEVDIPIIGRPCSQDYNNVAERKEINLNGIDREITDICIKYDGLYLKDGSVKHQEWLSRHLPVHSENIRKRLGKTCKKLQKSIFLSASIPSREREPRYYDTVDVIAIRDAIRELAANVLPYVRLVWGGHPSITPLIRNVLERMGMPREEIRHHVTLYQSAFFSGLFPKDNEFVEDIQIVPAHGSITESLREMRKQMINSTHNYIAGIFIGGMEGVEEEYKWFCEYHPKALRLPIASTGAAALKLFEADETIKLPEDFDKGRLKDDYNYQALFKDLLLKKEY